MTLSFAKPGGIPQCWSADILHSLLTNLNWVSLKLCAPSLHSEIVGSTLPASCQHPLTPKQVNTLNWVAGRWQIPAMRERGWVCFWMNVKALAKRRVWTLHYPPTDTFLTASPNPQDAERKSTAMSWVLGGGEEGDAVLVTVTTVSAPVLWATAVTLSRTDLTSCR